MRCFLLACLPFALSNVACGSDSPAGTAGQSPAATNAATTGSAGAGGAGGDGAHGAGGSADGGGSTSQLIGGVYAISDTVHGTGSSMQSARAGAFFVQQTGADHSKTSRTVGPCVLDKFGSGRGPRETDLSAGALHISGGVAPLDLSPSPKGTYAPVQQATALWNGGERITAAADGAAVPAFDVSLTAPSPITLTSPTAAGSGADLTFSRSAPFDAAWTGASSGKVVLYFDIATATAAFAVTCSFDPAPGSAQVPAAAFADFPPGQGTFNFYVLETASASPDSWSISFSASSTVIDTAGDAAAGSTLIQ